MAGVAWRRRCRGAATRRGGVDAGGVDGGQTELERVVGALAVLGERSGGAEVWESRSARWRNSADVGDEGGRGGAQKPNH